MVWNGNGCQAEIPIQWINCYQNQLRGWELEVNRAAAISPQDLLMWQHKSNQDEVWKTGGDYSLHDLHHVGKLANQFIHTQSFKLKKKVRWTISLEEKKPPKPGILLLLIAYPTAAVQSYMLLEFVLWCQDRKLFLSTSCPVYQGKLVIASFSHFHFINLFITKKNVWTSP